MHRSIVDNLRGYFFWRTVLPVACAILALGLVVAALLLWSSYATDKVAIDKQRRLVARVVSDLQMTIAHNQESVTVWDDAVEAVRAAPPDGQWIDANLGAWMKTYFGHDAAFVLGPQDMPIYAFVHERMLEPSSFTMIAAPVMPLVEDLRERLRSGDQTGVGGKILSTGVSDLKVVLGRPSIVSVKPIVSDTGEIEQVPGEEYLHVAVRFLDGSFTQALQENYMFDNLRFSWMSDPGKGEASFALHTGTGDVLGYFIWRPYRPGSAVLATIAPAIGTAYLLSIVLVALLLATIARRSVSLKASEAQLRYLALHDPLSGLLNRAAYNDALDTTLARRGWTRDQIAVLYLDLDHFKHVNDTLGHPVGDSLIRQFCERLKTVVGEGAVMARVGGDEFMLTIENAPTFKAVDHLCQSIIDSMRRPFDIEGNQLFIGLTLGVAFAPHHGTTRTELVRKADIALYHAKGARTHCAVFRPDMEVQLQRRRNVERDLRAALKGRNELTVHYQPRYAAATHKLTGVEALIRWNHPEHGSITPQIFIPIAEETGLMEALGEFVLHTTCLEAKSWPVENVAVNVSAVELANPGYTARVAQVLRRTGMDPRKLELEVTESALTDGLSGNCVRNVKALREMGVSVALDDFGTGFSSLARLRQLEVDRIKVDRSFVNGLGSDNGDEALVRAMVELAHAKGLKITAEGVETVQQSEYLRQIDCDELQGFLFSEPVPAEEIERIPGFGRREKAKSSSAA